jgi:3-oxoacyl-[acyl-carrier protein] reductase
LILGASGGIGSAIAHRLGRDNVPLVLHGRQRDQLEAVAATLPGCALELADVSSEDEVNALAARLRQQFGRLSGAVYSIAAPFANRLAHRTRWSAFETQIDNQLRGIHYCATALLPLLSQDDETTRLVILSTEFVIGAPPVKTAPYVAAKAALTAYSRVIAQEWLDKGVRVHIVAPGMVKTKLVSNMPDEFLEDVASRMPEGRLTTAEDVAETVAFLFTAAADPMYGTPIHVSRAARR